MEVPSRILRPSRIVGPILSFLLGFAFLAQIPILRPRVETLKTATGRTDPPELGWVKILWVKV